MGSVRNDGMTTSLSELPTDLATAHELIRQLAETVRTQEHFIEKLQHQLEQLLRQRYGRKSEKIDPDQLLLFAREILAAMETEPPATEPPADPPPAPAEPSPTKKNGHGRKPLPASLPRQRVVHDLAPDQLPCPDCGAVRIPIGEEIREQLEYVPASLIVLQHVRPKYACRACEANVAIAERLPEPIEKGLPGPGLLAQVIVSKYADHLPLYRQERIFARQGVELPRQTTCDWMAVCADLLEPIWKAMLLRILLSRVIQTDDTPVRVQDPITGAMTTGRLWAYLGDWDHRFIVYDYTPDRSGEGPERILAGFRSGYLQSDAYSVYDQIHARGIVEVGCLAHARRKFDEAQTSDPERAHAGLAWIGRLYQIEREARERVSEASERLAQERQRDAAERMAAEQRLAEEITHKLRQEQSRPLVEKFAEWLETVATQVLPKSPIAEAIAYARSNWAALTRYLDAGFLSIDNNAAERAMRPIAVGRKNWLHLGSDRGGRTAAVLMSLVQSCRSFGVEPFAYLRDVLDRVSTHPASRIAELLPDAWKASRS
jgi:transposase